MKPMMNTGGAMDFSNISALSEEERKKKELEELRKKGAMGAVMDTASDLDNATGNVVSNAGKYLSDTASKAAETAGGWGREFAGMVGLAEDPALYDELFEVEDLRKAGKLSDERAARMDAQLRQEAMDRYHATMDIEGGGPIAPDQLERQVRTDLMNASGGKEVTDAEVQAAVDAELAPGKEAIMDEYEESRRKRDTMKNIGAGVLSALLGGGSRGGGGGLMGGSQLIGASAPSGGALGNGLRFKDIV